MFKLDLIFRMYGNGYGLASPSMDDCFYWLDGELYTWCGGFGAQLQSFEWSWKVPKPQDRRKLFGYDFKPFQVGGKFPLKRVSWQAVMPERADQAALVKMKSELDSWWG